MPAHQHLPVVVGVDGSAGSQAALDFAFETASMRGSEVLVVHAADVPETYPRPDRWLDPTNAPWTDAAALLVAESLAGWSEKYPDVVVRTRFVPGHPVQVLALESRPADLVVVGGFAGPPSPRSGWDQSPVACCITATAR